MACSKPSSGWSTQQSVLAFVEDVKRTMLEMKESTNTTPIELEKRPATAFMQVAHSLLEGSGNNDTDILEELGNIASHLGLVMVNADDFGKGLMRLSDVSQESVSVPFDRPRPQVVSHGISGYVNYGIMVWMQSFCQWIWWNPWLGQMTWRKVEKECLDCPSILKNQVHHSGHQDCCRRI